MSNWDDEEEYSAPAHNNFDDEDDDDVLDDWEAEESSDDETKPAKPTRKRVGIEQRIAEREAKERAEREKAALERADDDEATKKLKQKQAELDSDLNNAASLFSSIDIHPRSLANQQEGGGSGGPTKLSDLAIFKATNKQEFDNLRKTLAPLLCELANVSSLQYGNFVTELCRDVCKAANVDQIRKVTSTLNALTNEKVREERASRGKKKKPIAKAASQKVDDAKDVTNYDDFDDDDFM